MKHTNILCLFLSICILHGCQKQLDPDRGGSGSGSTSQMEIPMWDQRAFLPPKEPKSERPNFLVKEKVMSVMKIDRSAKAEIRQEADNAVKYRTDQWAFKINPTKGKSWFVNKREDKDPVSLDHNRTFDKEHKEVDSQGRKLLNELGLEQKQLRSAGISNIISSAMSEKETKDYIDGFIIQFSRTLDGMPVFSSRVSVRFSPELELLSWNVRWFEDRAPVKLAALTKEEIKNMLAPIIDSSKMYEVSKQWMALPTKDNRTVLVPGYVVMQENTRAAIPAIEIKGEITRILAMPQIPPSSDMDEPLKPG